ncbi:MULTISPECIES: glycosyltransferase [Paenibacillus]|uniref:glycosyltransferase n=1 Tax=Paenibacillus TaxID=44249 RepID=UPI0004901842|nr:MULTISPECIES: glycosyltransferase [Paenibacillus]
MKKSSISLCMIVKNEERCLERCLNSVQNIVSEIIIVDTGSTDRTIEIAKQYTDKVYSFEWTNDFSEARNYALDQATGEYILHLDADEYLYEGVENLQCELDKAYYFLRIRNELGMGRTQTHQFVRLFRNQPSMRYEGKLHEQINLEKNAHLPSGYMNCVIYHDGYLDSIVKGKNKSKRNMEIIKNAILTSPTSFNYYNLGLQYYHEGQYANAVNAFKKSYSIAKNQTFTSRMLILLINSLLKLEQYPQALEIASDSILLYPENPTMWYEVGSVYQQIGYVEDAMICFNKCLELGEDSGIKEYDHHDGSGSYLAHSRLSELYLLQGEYEQAQEHFFLAVKEAPDLLYLVKLFTDLYPNLSGQDLLAAMIKIWPFNDVKRIQQFLSLLYELRHPVTYELIKCYRVEIDDEIRAWIDMIDGDYDQALMKWSHISKLQPYSKRDLFLLSFITNSFDVMARFKSELGLRDKEWKWWRELIEQHQDNGLELSQESEEFWSHLCSDLIKLQKYDCLETLIGTTVNPRLRYLIAKELNKNGFAELALEVIIESENKKENINIYELVSDILMKLGQVEDAIYYAEKLYQLDKNYQTSYRLLRLLKMENKIAGAALVQELKRNSLKSPWIESIIVND